jgi:gamma-glutamyltranspeptidase/glutathione hydrolase
MRKALFASLLALGVGAAQSAFSQSPPTASGRHGMVVSTQHLATEVGLDILKKGGNAVDAAIAVGYALAVVHPAAGNLGGGGFMTIRFADGISRFIDFRERAPMNAKPTLFLDKNGNVNEELTEIGYLAAGVPGTVAGFEQARERYGTLQREDLIAPAIDLADRGFLLREGDVKNVAEVAPGLARDPEAAHIFLTEDKEAPPVGTRLHQPDLAQSLRMIVMGGTDAFYRGPIADAIVAASDAHGGILKKEDFERYLVHERKPVVCTYRGYKITTAAPPSSGGTTLCELLNIVEGYDMDTLGYHSAASIHVLAEAMRHAFFDRNSSMGDPDFVKNPIEHMTDKNYAKEIRAHIRPDRATPSKSLGSVTVAQEGPHTTDFAVIDKWGTAVSVVYTLNDWFGAKVVAPGTGIVLNNEMDDFSAKPGEPNEDGLVTGANNQILPGKAPLSSMTPTIMSRPDGRTVLIIGSFGSGTIITSIAQAIVNLVDYHMSVQEAVDAPRIHQQWLPDTTYAEPYAINPDTRRILETMGHHFVEVDPGNHLEAILVGAPRLGARPAGPNRFYGANDPRRNTGLALGY